MSSKPARKTYARTSAGLRDALFDELEDLRNGDSSSHEATAFANLASRVLETAELEMKREEFDLRMERQRLELERSKRELRAEKILCLPAPQETA